MKTPKEAAKQIYKLGMTARTDKEVLLRFGDYIAARDAEWQAKEDRLEELAEDVSQWSKAYPVSVFPEPTPEEVRRVCDAVGVSPDCISAMVLRQFTKTWSDQARAALAESEAAHE